MNPSPDTCGGTKMTMTTSMIGDSVFWVIHSSFSQAIMIDTATGTWKTMLRIHVLRWLTVLRSKPRSYREPVEAIPSQLRRCHRSRRTTNTTQEMQHRKIGPLEFNYRSITPPYKKVSMNVKRHGDGNDRNCKRYLWTRTQCWSHFTVRVIMTGERKRWITEKKMWKEIGIRNIKQGGKENVF